ncbi:MAG: hypothetical protein GDA49_03945 [Rhodospirillales bacterium]|nr:hypothetical protein [Rhodospirillales bacterium]
MIGPHPSNGGRTSITDADAGRQRGRGRSHVRSRNGQGAGLMAQGLARATGKPGVALVISGSGVTNAATAGPLRQRILIQTARPEPIASFGVQTWNMLPIPSGDTDPTSAIRERSCPRPYDCLFTPSAPGSWPA